MPITWVILQFGALTQSSSRKERSFLLELERETRQVMLRVIINGITAAVSPQYRVTVMRWGHGPFREGGSCRRCWK